MDRRKIVGRAGEMLAAEYMEKKGYKVVERNFRIGKKELDLILRKDLEYVFVEVKTRTSFVFDGADTALGARQLQTLKKAIDYYCRAKSIDLEHVRLDFIAVDIDEQKNTANLQHFEKIY